MAGKIPPSLDDTVVTDMSWIVESHELDGDWEIEIFAEPPPVPFQDVQPTCIWAPPPSLLRRIQDYPDGHQEAPHREAPPPSLHRQIKGYPDEHRESDRYFRLLLGDDPDDATTPLMNVDLRFLR